MVEVPVAAPQTATVEPSGAGKKTAVRVRKVIKKKIVKKIIPKVVHLSKKDSVSSPQPAETADQETLVAETGPDNPSSDAAAGDALLAENNDVDKEKDIHKERDDGKKDTHVDQDEKDDFEEQQDKENDAQRKQDKEEGHNETVAAGDEMVGLSKQQDKGNDAKKKQDKGEGHNEGVVAATDEMDGMSEQQDKEEGHNEAMVAASDEMAGMSKRKNRRKTEIFIGGLSRDAKEEDLRKVFGKVGEIVEVRMMMDGQTGKNKGYAFLRYEDPAHAKKAVSEFPKVEVITFFVLCL